VEFYRAADCREAEWINLVGIVIRFRRGSSLSCSPMWKGRAVFGRRTRFLQPEAWKFTMPWFAALSKGRAGTSSDGPGITFVRRSRTPKRRLTPLCPFRMNSLERIGEADLQYGCASDFTEATPHAAATITSEPSPTGRVVWKPAPRVARFSFPAMWLRSSTSNCVRWDVIVCETYPSRCSSTRSGARIFRRSISLTRRERRFAMRTLQPSVS